MSTNDQSGIGAKNGWWRSLSGRMLQEIISEPIMRMGWNLANTEAVDRFLDTLESFIGPRWTGMTVTSSAELIKLVGPAREFLEKKGVPPVVVFAVNGIIEQAAQGIWARRQADGVMPNAPLTPQQVKAGFRQARETTHQRLRKRQEEFMSVMNQLIPEKRAKLLAKLAQLGEFQSTFDSFYRDKVMATKDGATEWLWVLADLAEMDVAQWPGFLASVYGSPPAPATSGATASKIFGPLGQMVGAAKQHLDSALNIVDPNNDPAVARMNKLSDRLRRRRSV